MDVSMPLFEGFRDDPMALDDAAEEEDAAEPPPAAVSEGTVAPDASNTASPTTVAQQPRRRRKSKASRDDSPTTGSQAPSGAPGTGSGGTGSAGSAAINEFTRRPNWHARLVEELRDTLQIVDKDLRITYTAPGIRQLAGYDPAELAGELLTSYVHPDDIGVVTAELNQCIGQGTPLRVFYRLRRRDGTYAIVETTGHSHIAAPKYGPNPNNKSPFCQAVFLSLRPYGIGENTMLLDSFLEHKMEAERLKARIAFLEREEDEEDDAQRSWVASRSDVGGPSAATTAGQSEEGNQDRTSSSVNGVPTTNMGPPSQPRGSGALTRENLEGAIASSRPDSIRDKMLRYEGAGVSAAPNRAAGPGHAEHIEMLTGLRYLDGERSERTAQQLLTGGGAGVRSGSGEISGNTNGIDSGIAGGSSTPLAGGTASAATAGTTTGRGSGGGRNQEFITGDAGIAILLGRDNRAGEKKKKQKVVEEYVCTDCGKPPSPPSLYALKIGMKTQSLLHLSQERSTLLSGEEDQRDPRRCAMPAACASPSSRRIASGWKADRTAQAWIRRSSPHTWTTRLHEMQQVHWRQRDGVKDMNCSDRTQRTRWSGFCVWSCNTDHDCL